MPDFVNGFVRRAVGSQAASSRPASSLGWTGTEASTSASLRDSLRPPLTEPGRESPVMAAIGDGAAVTCEPVPVRPDWHSCRMASHQVVAVILSQADRLLLCHRAPTRRWYPDVWDFPGGHVEPEERPEEALRREILEELGVELEGVDGAPVLHRFVPDTGLDLTVWVSRCWRGNVTNMQPEEHDAIGWFRREQLVGLRFADPSYLGLLQGLLRE